MYVDCKLGKVCIPFDPKQVDSFDITNVPTLSNVIRDIGASKTGQIYCLEQSFNVFKTFLKKLKVENIEEIRQYRAQNGKTKRQKNLTL